MTELLEFDTTLAELAQVGSVVAHRLVIQGRGNDGPPCLTTL